MAETLKSALKRWREGYLLSLLLSTVAKQMWFACDNIRGQLQSKVARNGVTINLPNGTKMTIGRDAGVGLASLLFWHGLDGYEPETSKTLRFFFSRSATFVDVGANCGFYSILAALWNPDIRVAAFEPVGPIYQRLQKNIALNRLQHRVTCENFALSSQSGHALLRLPPAEGRDLATTGTLAAEGWQVRQGCPTVQVETSRFDDYEQRHPMRVDLVKIDVEDFEADVLEGMSATIQRNRPFIVCEILERNGEHRNEKTRKLIRDLNYTPYWITSSGYVRVSRFDFCRKDSQDFILSPVSTDDEVVADLSLLFNARSERRHRNLYALGEPEKRMRGPAVASN